MCFGNAGFISGSKFISDDLNLLELLSKSLLENPETMVRIGIHPGTPDKVGYVKGLMDWLNTHAELESIRIVVPKSVYENLDTTCLTPHVIVSDLTGDEMFSVSNAVASSPPATIAGQAALKGKPVYCLPDSKIRSYFGCLFASSPDELHQRAIKDQMTKAALGLDDIESDVVIANMIRIR